MEEIWKTIEGYPSYMVSNMGRVKSLNYRRTGIEKILKPKINEKGYYYYSLFIDGKEYKFRIHRLVALHFIPNPNNLPEVNHKDENKANNCVENLEWCDRKYNCNYGTSKKKISKALSVPILQYSKDGSLIRKWNNAKDAEKVLGVDDSHIGKCCKGIYKTVGGYVWKYYDKETYLIGIMNNNFKYAA